MKHLTTPALYQARGRQGANREQTEKQDKIKPVRASAQAVNSANGFILSYFLIITYSMKSGKTYCCDAQHTRNPLFVFRLIPQERYGGQHWRLFKTQITSCAAKKWLKEHKGMDIQVYTKLYDGYTEDSNPVLFFHVKEDL